MGQDSLKKLGLAAAVAAGLFIGGLQPAKADLSKEEVEKIVESYILQHGDVVLKSVDDFQRKDMEERRLHAVEQNKEELFYNEKSPFIGNPDGDVTLIEFFDYNCHYCKDLFPSLKALSEGDKKLKIIFKDLPILGPTSETSARWALAAQRQGKYFEFHQKMMEHKGPIRDDDLESIAKDIGLDLGKVKHDVDGTDVLIQLERNRSLAGQMNFSGTPSFVIDNVAFSGSVSKDELVQRIEEARAHKKGKDDKKDDTKKPE